VRPPAFILDVHAQRRLRQREVSIEDVEYVLTNFDERRPARPLPRRLPSEFLVASVRGRRLRVYVEIGSEPMYVTTVAWEDHG
jgi:hypothetical protein